MWKRPCKRRKTPCYRRNSQSQNRSIAARIYRCVMIEIGNSVRMFGKIFQRRNHQSDCGGLNFFSMCDINSWEKGKQNSLCNKRNNL